MNLWSHTNKNDCLTLAQRNLRSSASKRSPSQGQSTASSPFPKRELKK